MLDPKSSVTSVVNEVEIDAPVDLIWNTILDFPSYTTWNPFVRSQTIMDASWKTPLVDQKPVVGSNLQMKVHIPPAVAMTDPNQVKGISREVVTYINEDTKTVIWDLASPSWFLRSRREQTITEIDMNGKKMAKYVSIEILDGVGAWIIRFILLSRLKKALDAVAEALKDYTERKAVEITQ